MAHLLPKPEDLLDSINTHDFAFVRAKQALDDDNDIFTELEMVRTQFLKLKQKYIALETKQALLTAFDTNKINTITSETIASFEARAQEKRAEIAAIRKETKQLKDTLHSVIEEIAELWPDFQSAKEEFEKVRSNVGIYGSYVVFREFLTDYATYSSLSHSTKMRVSRTDLITRKSSKRTRAHTLTVKLLKRSFKWTPKPA